jgi:hypothetical protein
LRAIDFVERLLAQAGLVAQLAQAREPLAGGAEEHGILAAPAVRVLVLDLLAGLVEQEAGLGQVGDDLGIGLEDLHAGPVGNLGGVAAHAVDRRVHIQPFVAADGIVVGAVARRRVHQARAGVQRGVRGEGQAEILVRLGRGDEGMLVAQPRSRAAFA